ncbi:cytochrome P450 [Agrocybe pediades]|nr:cytochrome P450 [Agrocybe pediades]
MIVQAILAILITHYCISLYRRSKLRHIPTLGYSWPLLSYITAFKYEKHGFKLVEEGYRKFPNKVWKIRTLDEQAGDGWYIIANGTQSVEDISKAPNDQLSSTIFFGSDITTNPYHVNVVRLGMKKNIVLQYHEMYREIRDTLEDSLKLTSTGDGEAQSEKTCPFSRLLTCLPPPSEWVTLPLSQTILEACARVYARLVVGHPHSENPEYTRIFAGAVKHILEGKNLRVYPKFLRPFISRVSIKTHGDIQRLADLIEPLLKAIKREEKKHNGDDWPEKPRNILSWTLDEARRSGVSELPCDIAKRLYLTALSLEGISRTVALALYELSIRPASVYLNDIREEVRTVIEEVARFSPAPNQDALKLYEEQRGWEKIAIDMMHKLDSFVKEVLRYHDNQPVHLGSRVLKDFVFSDGTFIPAGSTLFVNSRGAHMDEELLENADTFNGFRYFKEQDQDQPRALAEQVGARDPLTRTAFAYYTFGYGKHACPGRFTASYIIKTMLARILTDYDFELTESTQVYAETHRFPDESAMEMRFRKKVEE